MKRAKTYYKLDYHLVFIIKDRFEIITPDLMAKIRQVAYKKAAELNFEIHIINGYKDHIHLLLSIPPKYALSETVRHIKGFTSKMIPHLTWQQGYGAFTVDETSFDRIFNYIKNQQEHHSL